MARKSNVNPDHYRTAGRERPGQGVVQEVNKKKYTEAKRRHGRGTPKPKRNISPVAASLGVSDQASEAKMRQQMPKKEGSV